TTPGAVPARGASEYREADRRTGRRDTPLVRPSRARRAHADAARGSLRHYAITGQRDREEKVVEALRLEQGTSEWLEYRRTRGTASETAALMSCAPWFPRTPYELWTVKTGRAKVPENPAMRRGAALERQARELAEQVLGEPFMPHVFERDRMIASLDGISFCGTRGLEIKCPVKGAESDVWQAVEAGAPPAHYMWQ